MKILNNFQGSNRYAESVVTIGKFDGIHRGHQELIHRTVESARRRGDSVVFSFDMSPAMLLSKEERIHMLEKMGVDVLVECPFGPEIITMTAEDFVEKILVDRFHVRKVIVGETFRFGYKRRGDGAFLKEMGKKFHFETELVPEVKDHGVKISSSAIREELLAGHMERVHELLGYEFYVTGRIIHGRELGRTIGVPTANLIADQSKMLPPNGVYFTSADIAGRAYHGVTNIGTKPTVDGHFLGVETNFFDWDGNLYGERLLIRLLHFSRPEHKFASVEELKARISKDEEEARAYFLDRA